MAMTSAIGDESEGTASTDAPEVGAPESGEQPKDEPASDVPEPATADAMTAEDDAEPTSVAGPFALDVSKLTPMEKKRTIVLADGSRVWALNDCVDTDELAWSADRTMSPIIGIKHGPSFDALRARRRFDDDDLRRADEQRGLGRGRRVHATHPTR